MVRYDLRRSCSDSFSKNTARRVAERVQYERASQVNLNTAFWGMKDRQEGESNSRNMESVSFRVIEEALGLTMPLVVSESTLWPDSLDDDDCFDELIAPSDILDPNSGVLWGGQMLPDSFPIWGNGCGDVIAARIGLDGAFFELVQWEHEGGYWLPTDLVKDHQAPGAVPHRKAEQALSTGLSKYLRAHGAYDLGTKLGVPPSEVLEWVNDTSAVDESLRERLCELAGQDEIDLLGQDWEVAGEWARMAAGQRSDLSWPEAVLGRIAERNGKLEEALKWYRVSLQGLQSTAGFTRAWEERGLPYVTLRLQALGGALPDSEISEPDASDLNAVRRHWIQAGKMALDRKDGKAAYECFYRAGWDRFFTNEMEEVLELLIHAAELVPSPALAELARLHLRSCHGVGEGGSEAQ